MSRGKKSFFERLTGSVNTDNNDGYYEEQPHEDYQDFDDDFQSDNDMQNLEDDWSGDQYAQSQDQEQFDDTGELAVDVYETAEQIVVQAMVAGVRPDALDVSITREQCTIEGRREAPHEAGPDQYIHQELYWGAFSRVVQLPAEVEVEEADASEDHGLLTIKLPKINKDQETKLEINSG